MEKTCIRCGNCCDEFPMTYGQIRKIKEYLENNYDILISLRNTPELYHPGRRVCPFLRGDVGSTYCTIYPVRPEICKAISVKGLDNAFSCPEGTVSTEYTPGDVAEMLKVYTHPTERFVKNPGDLFRDLIKGE